MNDVPNLERLQAMLQDCILHGDAAIHASIAERLPLEVGDRLGIYRHAYRARLADTLRDSYGHTATFFGEAFDALAAAFVESHSSGHASLRGYGFEFPEWLADAEAGGPEAAELAALDRALRDAFDCADSPAITWADLAAIDAAAWGEVVFGFVPSYARLRFEHNTLAVWQAIDDGETPPVTRRLDRIVEVLVWRRGLRPHFRSLAAFEAAALDELRAGRDFATACERLAQSFPAADVGVEAGRHLRRWLEEEVLSSAVVTAFAAESGAI